MPDANTNMGQGTTGLSNSPGMEEELRRRFFSGQTRPPAVEANAKRSLDAYNAGEPGPGSLNGQATQLILSRLGSFEADPKGYMAGLGKRIKDMEAALKAVVDSGTGNKEAENTYQTVINLLRQDQMDKQNQAAGINSGRKSADADYLNLRPGRTEGAPGER